jgi:tRNA A-37 threonylcarbamoyl transferase component Bud32/tetratricopeptide (TPR) repeat protein
VLSTGLSDLKAALSDRYIIEREIARGGMATVYLATDTRHDREVALKVMHPEIALALGRERFLREIKLTAKLSHPNILTVHDSGEAGEHLWYVMPYVEGESLRARLKSDAKPTVDETVTFMREAADAIGYAHSLGVVHRDIKPENILISRGHAVIADFGIARAIDAARDENLTASGVALGTTSYMSPEQALGEEVDAATDVWALGSVMYEMLAGKPPFGSGGREVLSRTLTTRPVPLRIVRPGIPEELSQVIDKSLAREKSERYANGADFVTALDGYRGSSILRLGRRRTVLVTAIAIAAVVLAGAAMMLLSRREPTVASPPSAQPTTAEPLSSDSVARELYRVAKVEQLRRTAPSLARAIGLYSQVLARDSVYAPAWARLALTAEIAYVRAFDIPGISRDSLLRLTVAASERAIEVGPDKAASWLAKGRASRLVDPTDNGPAIFAIRKSLALDSTNSDAWHALALAEQENLHDSVAIDAWLRGAEVNPGDIQTLSFIGLHYMWNNQYDEGMKWADSTIKLDPTYQIGRSTAGQIAVAAGKPLDALRHYDVLMKLTNGREQVTPLALMAIAEAALGDRAKARESIKIAKGLFDMKKPAVHEAAYVGAALAAVGDTVEAVQVLKAYSPRTDLHFQLHLKRDPALHWLDGPWGKGLVK